MSTQQQNRLNKATDARQYSKPPLNRCVLISHFVFMLSEVKLRESHGTVDAFTSSNKFPFKITFTSITQLLSCFKLSSMPSGAFHTFTSIKIHCQWIKSCEYIGRFLPVFEHTFSY